MQLAKIQRLQPDGEVQVVHRMGDVGYFDTEGRLWFCGRKSHRVELLDRTLFSAPVEEVFNTHPDVLRTALVGVTLGGVRVPLLCVERRPTATATEAALFGQLRELGATVAGTRGIDRFLTHPGFPVDIRHNAKIGREKLAVWAQSRVKG
jgi:acyl-coenzyme A synthetase/AMP-(fatty) acid ligase